MVQSSVEAYGQSIFYKEVYRVWRERWLLMEMSKQAAKAFSFAAAYGRRTPGTISGSIRRSPDLELRVVEEEPGAPVCNHVWEEMSQGGAVIECEKCGDMAVNMFPKGKNKNGNIYPFPPLAFPANQRHG